MTKIELARERKLSGRWNCAQAISCTYCDAVGVDESAMNAAGAAFGSGMGCLEGTCGAIIGAGLIIGARHNADRAKAMKAMRRIIERFQERNGATICKHLKGIDTGISLRQCPDCVADAAEFLEDELALPNP